MGNIVLSVFVAIQWFALHETYPIVAWAIVVLFLVWLAWFFLWRAQRDDMEKVEAKRKAKADQKTVRNRPGKLYQRQHWTQSTKENAWQRQARKYVDNASDHDHR